MIYNIKKNFIKYSFFTFCLLVIISWFYIFFSEPESLSKLFDERNIEYLIRFLKRLFGLNEEIPAFLDKEMWKQGLILSIQTFEMSILATGIATVVMLILVIPSARNISNGKLTLNKKWYNNKLYF